MCENKPPEPLAAESGAESDISNLFSGDISISELVTGGTELLNQSMLLDIINHVELQLPANDGDSQCPNPHVCEVVRD